MAQRRMFSDKIVDSDAFLDMPTSSQVLYFHLAMRADDDGFVGSPKKIMRLVGVNDDDLKVLMTKRFLLNFKSGVVVIKHWLIHNLIRSDMYKETTYLKEKSELGLNSYGAYTELRDGVEELKKIDKPQWLQNRLKGTVHKRTDVVPLSAPRIGKDRIGKDRETAKAVSVSDSKEISPFNFSEYLETMVTDQKPHIRLIASYFHFKGSSFDSVGEVQTAIKRHLRDAVKVSTFGKIKIIRAMEECVKEENERPIGWTLGTVLKKLTK